MAEKKRKKKKKRSVFNIIINIVLVIAIICFVGSGAYLFRYYYISWNAEKNVDALRLKVTEVDEAKEPETAVVDVKGEEEVIDARYLELLSENSDFVGWVSIEGTSLNYPVMYTPEDNEFYLHRNFDKEYEFSGLPFVDARCSLKNPSQNIVIYGHHMNTDTMFTAMDNYMEEDFFKDNQYIQFDTIYRSGTYQICYVIKSRALYANEEGFRYYDFINASNEAEFDQFVEEIEARKLYDTGNSISMDDELITLSTCEYSQTNGRLALIAKRVEK